MQRSILPYFVSMPALYLHCSLLGQSLHLSRAPERHGHTVAGFFHSVAVTQNTRVQETRGSCPSVVVGTCPQHCFVHSTVVHMGWQSV